MADYVTYVKHKFNFEILSTPLRNLRLLPHCPASSQARREMKGPVLLLKYKRQMKLVNAE